MEYMKKILMDIELTSASSNIVNLLLFHNRDHNDLVTSLHRFLQAPGGIHKQLQDYDVTSANHVNV